ncbi:MAG: YihY/virulence factor BrkB family protein [Flavisolibacter sp.]
MAESIHSPKTAAETTTKRQPISLLQKLYWPGMDGISLPELWKSFMMQLKKTSLVERASGISFNVVMAIPPILIFVFTLIPLLPISKQFIHQLFALIRDIIPGDKNNFVVIKFLDDFMHKPRTGLLSFGLLLAIYFSSNAMMGILRSFDRDYPGFRKRKFLNKRKVALQLTLIVFVLILICLSLLIAQSAVLKWIGIKGSSLRSIIHNFRWIIIVLLTYLIVSFIYRHGPAVAKKWAFITPGSIFATTLMLVASAIVSYWVNHFNNYNKLYGSIGAIFILMSLIYANSLAILMGFELNVTLDNLKREQDLKSR